VIRAVPVLLLALLGCGGEEEQAAGPTWPPPGCESFSVSYRSFEEDAPGAASARAAVLAEIDDAVEVVRAPAPEPHRRRLWWVLDESGTVLAAVGAVDLGRGWLVDTVERCAE
jgi:hypothetical protein